MGLSLYRCPELPAAGASGEVTGPEARHAVVVARLRSGERVLLGDGRGGLAECLVDAVAPDRFDVTVLARRDEEPPSPQVTLVQALPKGERGDLAVDLATEAGVDAIVPWQAARCVARWQGVKARRGVERWQATAASAAKQARRAYVPEVAELAGTAAVARLVAEVSGAGGVVALLHEEAARPFAALPVRDASRVVLVVGPEGGIAPEEIATLTAAGGVPVLLGPHVLRTSTAGAVALGALGVLTDRWGRP